MLCFSILVFFSASVQAITKEVIENVKQSIVLLSSNTKAKPGFKDQNALCAGSVINEKGHILK